MRRGPGTGIVLLVVALLLGACRAAPSDEHVIQEQAKVDAVDGSDLARITLTEGAAARLDIQTAPVVEDGDGFVIPDAAVIVDPSGVFWVYTSPEPLVFVRHEISIDRQAGDRAHLSAGPPAGTEIVTVGVSELYGAETGIGY